MDNTQIAYSLLVGFVFGTIIMFGAMMNYVKKILKNIMELKTAIENNNMMEDFIREVPEPVREMPAQIKAAEPIIEPPKAPEPVVPKEPKVEVTATVEPVEKPTRNQIMMEKVKLMNEAKKKKRLEKELAKLKEQEDKIKKQFQ